MSLLLQNFCLRRIFNTMSCSYPSLLLSKDVFGSVATTIFTNSFTVFTTTKLLHVMFIPELRNVISASNSFNTLKMSPHHRLLSRYYLEWLKSCHKIVCSGHSSQLHIHPLDGDVSFINSLEHLRSDCFVTHWSKATLEESSPSSRFFLTARNSTHASPFFKPSWACQSHNSGGHIRLVPCTSTNLLVVSSGSGWYG